MKEFYFDSYMIRLLAVNLSHIILIIFKFKILEAFIFVYYMSVLIFYSCPTEKKPVFETEHTLQKTLEMYHLTFLGKIHGKFMFFYVRRVNEIDYRVILGSSINKKLVIEKELKFDNKSVHKV